MISISRYQSLGSTPTKSERIDEVGDASLCYSSESPNIVPLTETFFPYSHNEYLVTLTPQSKHLEDRQLESGQKSRQPDSASMKQNKFPSDISYYPQSSSYHLVTCGSTVSSQNNLSNIESIVGYCQAVVSSEGEEQVFQRPLQKPYIYRNLAEMDTQTAIKALRI